MKHQMFSFLFSILSITIWCQPQNTNALQTPSGKYHIQNFESKKDFTNHFESNFYSISNSSQDFIWVGTEEFGLAFYDGSEWRFVGSSPFSPVYVIHSNKNKMYFGGNNELGWLDRTVMDNRFFTYDDNHFNYNSLKEKLALEDQEFGIVRNIIPSNEYVFFETETHLFSFRDETPTLILKDSLPFKTIKFGKEILVWRSGKGLFRYKNNSLELLPYGEVLADINVNQMLPLDSNKLLIIPESNDLFILNHQSLKPLISKADQYLKTHTVTTAKLLFDHTSIAIGTKTGGVVIINSQGKLLAVFNKSNGLSSGEINDFFTDNHYNLWVAMKGGISCIEYPSPVSWFDEDFGLSGNIQALTEFENRLYIATSSGLFTKQLRPVPTNMNPLLNEKSPIFTKIKKIGQDCRSMCVIENTLFVAGSKGIFEWKNGKAYQKTNFSANILFRSTTQPSVIFIGAMDGLHKMEKSNNSWNYTGRIPNILGKINNIVEDRKGQLWLGSDQGCWKVSVLDLALVKHYRPMGKISSSGQWNGKFSGKVNLLLLDGYPYFQNERIGNWVYHEEGDSLIMSDKFVNKNILESLKPPMKKRLEVHTHFNNSGKFYFSSFGFNGINSSGIVFNSQGDTLLKGNKNHLWSKEIRRNGGYDIMHYSSDSTIYCGLPNGQLIRYEGRVEKPLKLPYQTYISSIVVFEPKDSSYKTIYNLETNQFDRILEYQNNSISISFTALGNYYNYENEFQYKLHLVGEEGAWVKEGNRNFTNLNNLKEGEYKFHVRSHSWGRDSEEATFSFTIKPPWYRSSLAYFTYFLFGIFSIWMIVKWRTKNLSYAKEILEKTVHERTFEISQQNQILRDQKEKIETLLKELNHRVKNNLQIISSLLSSQSRRLEDGDAQEAIKVGRNRVQAIALIHENLYKENHPTHIDMSIYIKNLVETIRDSFGFDFENIILNLDVTSILLDVNRAVPLGLIINEFVTNSFKYAFPNHDHPVLNITLQRRLDKKLQLIIRDNGSGLPIGFNPKESNSYGLKLVNGLTKQLSAELKYLNGKGTGYELIFDDKILKKST